MSISAAIISDFQQEAVHTRKLLEAIPGDKFDWKPHEKSMTLGQLSGHVAEMPTWIGAMVEDEMDFDAMLGDWKPFVPTSAAELTTSFEENLKSVPAALEGKDDAFMHSMWTMRKGDQVLMSSPKADCIRSTLIHHWAHHRGQLTVYLRLLDVPVPPTYGGTADLPVF